MIVRANNRLIATDDNDNAKKIGVSGELQDELKVSNIVAESLLLNILKQLKIVNLHLMSLSDEKINQNDID